MKRLRSLAHVCPPNNNLNEDIMLPLVKRLLENAGKTQPDIEGALRRKEVGNVAYKVWPYGRAEGQAPIQSSSEKCSENCSEFIF